MRITATQSAVQIRIEASGGKFGHQLGDRENAGPFGAGSVSGKPSLPRSQAPAPAAAVDKAAASAPGYARRAIGFSKRSGA